MKFRDHLPHDCPPEDAKEASGNVYMLVNDNTPKPEDFLSKREKHQDKPPFEPNEVECRACGLSVYTEISDLLNTRSRHRGFRKMKPALGKLTSEHGVIKHTPSHDSPTHHTWWIFNEATPWKIFKVINLSTESTIES
ncbi:hypothetical protein DSM106972_028110 [Dulcicalothrix desertica PCC 7102]|uniref:Uncharacterized protein n=1 Tax=Dulcicalothrix desertica PCC 7102 TaxID=232991 RepID=A0A3S1CNV9_9CYAN|nr:hypothetical protein [Dulcicalothrix desertica]RUT06554.1 hypothetical protein DSM106972_028110 [Dulcicalothrix desertica PCC 7102]TWH50331.1 hypothetical protein CAL7102_04630 [Dulcicalothrix desertica PCC 7102]